MPPPTGSVKITAGASAAALITATLAVWLLRGYIWPTLSNVEVDALRAMLDPSLFQRDFAVQACMNFTPRFYYNALILLPARAGLPLEWVFAGWHLVAVGTLLSGVRALARSVGLGETATAVLVLWLLTVSIGTLGLVFFYTSAPVPAVWAGALVAWGAAMAWRGRWLAAFAFFGAAVLLQFLVGLYAGLLALPVLWWTRRFKGLPCLAPWLLGLALVYVPMLLTGSTGTNVLGDEAFVAIYAKLRLPHHLVPSSWGWPVWVQAVAFYAGAGWYIHRTRVGRPPAEAAVLFGAIGLAAAALALNYFFIEVHPLALMAKLQPARLTPLVQGIALLLLATRVQASFARRDWLGGAALCLIPYSSFPGVLLILAAVLTPPDRGPRPPAWIKYVLPIAVVLAFQPLGASILSRGVNYTIWAALVASQVVAYHLVRRPFVLTALAGLAVLGASLCADKSRREDWPPFLAGRFSVNAPPSDAPGILGRRFAGRSPKDALVLVPPTSESWSFKLHARRAVIVDDKSNPFTDRGLREWHDRMTQVLGRPYTPGLDAEAAWRACSVESLVALARRYDAGYILSQDDSHPFFPGVALDRESGWTLWQLPEAGPRPALPPK